MMILPASAWGQVSSAPAPQAPGAQTPGTQAPGGPTPAQPQPLPQLPPAPVLGVEPVPQRPGPDPTLTGPPPPSQSHLPGPGLALSSLAPGTPPFELHPSLTLSEEYSDNFFLTSTDKTDNFRSRVSPGFFLGINRPNTRGTISASLDVVQDSIDSFGDFQFFPSLSATITHAFSPRLSVTVADSFTRGDDQALANQFGLQQQRQTSISNTLSVSADWLIDLLATQGYYRLFTFFGDDTDTITQIAGVALSLPVGALMTARAGYEFSQSNTSGSGSDPGTAFNDGSSLDDSTGNLIWASLARQFGQFRTVGVSTSYLSQSLDSARIWNISLFTSYELPGRFSLSGTIGGSFLTSDEGDRSAFTTNTTASYRFAKAVVSVALYQDFNPTFLQGENFGVTLTRSYTATFAYALTPFIDASLRASYSQNEFTGVGNNQGDPNANTLTASARVGWRIRPWLTSSLEYTFTNYSSVDDSGEGASENRVVLRLTGSF